MTDKQNATERQRASLSIVKIFSLVVAIDKRKRNLKAALGQP